MGIESELSSLKDIALLKDEPLSKHCTLRVGGNSKYFVYPLNETALINTVEICKSYSVKYKIVGYGSNILYGDNGFFGVIISTAKMQAVKVEGNTVSAESGVMLENVINTCIDKGLSGLENLTCIPCSVGGATVMNASAFGTAVSDCIESVKVYKDGKIFSVNKNQCDFGYRTSRFVKNCECVLSVDFLLKDKPRCEIYSSYSLCRIMRKNLQPKGRSCGSVFRNTEKYSAGKLIENTNLKGYRIGGATVSKMHANFILADNTATAQNVFDLIQFVKRAVYSKYKIMLNEEVEFVGDFK